MKKSFKNILKWLFVILVMLFIFYMSSRPSGLSDTDSGNIDNILIDIFNFNDYFTVDYIVRKLAHFIEYFILMILILFAMGKLKRKWLYALILCLLYSISDEVHQLFVIGRSCEIRDVLIDFFGSVVGLFCYYFFKKE